MVGYNSLRLNDITCSSPLRCHCCYLCSTSISPPVHTAYTPHTYNVNIVTPIFLYDVYIRWVPYEALKEFSPPETRWVLMDWLFCLCFLTLPLTLRALVWFVLTVAKCFRSGRQAKGVHSWVCERDGGDLLYVDWTTYSSQCLWLSLHLNCGLHTVWYGGVTVCQTFGRRVQRPNHNVYWFVFVIISHC